MISRGFMFIKFDTCITTIIIHEFNVDYVRLHEIITISKFEVESKENEFGIRCVD